MSARVLYLTLCNLCFAVLLAGVLFVWASAAVKWAWVGYSGLAAVVVVGCYAIARVQAEP